MASALTDGQVNGRKELLMLIFVLFAGVNLLLNMIRPVPDRGVTSLAR